MRYIILLSISLISLQAYFFLTEQEHNIVKEEASCNIFLYCKAEKSLNTLYVEFFTSKPVNIHKAAIPIYCVNTVKSLPKPFYRFCMLLNLKFNSIFIRACD